jgi:hypothetical protein
MAPRKMKMRMSKPKATHPAANLGSYLHKTKRPSKSKIKSIVSSMKKPKGY